MTDEQLARYCYANYGPILESVCVPKRFRPSLLAGLMMRESECGTSPLLKPSGPEGIGDKGHAYGLFQFDYRWHKVYIDTGRWKDPREACMYACDILTSNLNSLRLMSARSDSPEFDLERAMVAAYNCGCAGVISSIQRGSDIDGLTTGGDYSKDVFWKAEIYRSIKPIPNGVLAVT